MISRLLYLLFVIIFLAVAVVAIDAAVFFNTPLKNDDHEMLDVESGDNMHQVAHQLRHRDVIDHHRQIYYLIAYARLSGQATRIKEGEYQIPAHQKPGQVLELLASGKIRLRKLTLVEGWNFRQILTAIHQDSALDDTLEDKSGKEIMAALGYPGDKPEGRFMPDTYLFPRGETDVSFLKRAYRAMQEYLDQAWQERDDNLAINSPYEALILASLIEKETADPGERSRISGVFQRRLKKGMRLQTDPSVIYGIAEFDGRIHLSNLRKDTPYNTYTRSGLPPTPIAAPSRASIRAALHPTPGESLYFVSRGDGTHAFSRTLKEHNKAVQKYLKEDE